MFSARGRVAAAMQTATKRPRVVILGTGWGGNKLARSLDKKKFDVRLISPANHFLFTSFLPSTTVGTLEFRNIQEPVRTILGLDAYYQAKARHIDLDRQVVQCQDVFKGREFEVGFDYAVIATGCKTNTFGTPGVAELEGKEVFFLKHLHHARQIRNRTLECFERAGLPDCTEAEKRRLLQFVVVGGGPTSCEFTCEMHDFLKHDVVRLYPSLAPYVKMTVVEAGPSILGSFDRALIEYYGSGLEERGVDVRTSTAVVSVDERTDHGRHRTFAVLNDGTRLPFGMMVWSAGLAPVKFVQKCSFQKARGGRIVVDEHLRIPGQRGRLFAVGDCAADAEAPLPPVASAAEQQATYLADCFNDHYATFDPASDADLPLPGPVMASVGAPWPRSFYPKSATFRYQTVGQMASMGTLGGVVDLSKNDVAPVNSRVSGFVAMLIWRGGYLSKQLSWTNMIMIPLFWFKALVFGRDASSF